MVRAAPECVFELISTPERLPEWNVSVDRVRRATPGEPVAVGSRAVMSGRLLGQHIESETEVVEYEPPRLFATRAMRGPRLNTRFALDPVGDATRVQIEVSGQVPGGAIGERLAAGFLRRELSASLERLRALSEG